MNGTAATADTPYCDDVVIMGARGTGEQPGSGQVAGFGDSAGLAAVDLKKWIINNYIDANVGYKAIEYPALAPPTDPVLVGHSTTFISSGAFNGSVKQGVAAATSYLGALIATCPQTQVVMMGYSQGAEVMHEAANLYFGEHPEHSGNLSKVWLISDPTSWHVGVYDTPGGASYFTESGYGFIDDSKGLISLMASNNWSPTEVGGLFNTYVKDKVVEICHTSDDICNTDDQPYTSIDQLQEAASQLGLMFPSTHGTVYKDTYNDIHIAPSRHNAPEIAMAVASMRIPDSAPKMVSTWDTSLPGCSTITLPLTGDVKVKVDWGHGYSSPITSPSPSYDFSLEPLGEKIITVTGTFTGWNSSPSIGCITRVSRWDETGTTDLSNGFAYAYNLSDISSIPSGVTNMSGTMQYTTGFSGDLSGWDTSKVTDMSLIFQGAKSVNSLANWNTSSVTNLEAAFADREDNIAPDISKWDTSNVTNMSFLFYNSSFNGDLSNLNTSQVTNMSRMFYRSSFDGNLSKLDTSQVTDMSYMFAYSKFNHPIGEWDVSNVMYMSGMLAGPSFNQDISKWKTSNVVSMDSMFHASNFSGYIGDWDTSKVRNMSEMFLASTFNGDITRWNTYNVWNMSSMFANNESFSWDLSGWKVNSAYLHSNFSTHLDPKFVPMFFS